MISTAILLAAGEGSRLRSAAPFKPLCEVAGRSLLAHALDGLAEAGLKRVVVVLGYGADQIAAHIAAASLAVAVETVTDAAIIASPTALRCWRRSRWSGRRRRLLAMCDHLVEPALYRLCCGGRRIGGGARLGIDRRIDSDWVDLEDVTRVQTAGDRIVAIGKGLVAIRLFRHGRICHRRRALFAALRGLEIAVAD